MKSIFSAVFIALSINQVFSQEYFTKNKVLEDLTTLTQALEEGHIDPFAYTPKKEFLAVAQSVKARINVDSLSLLEVTNYFQELAASLNNGHTYLNFPAQPYFEYGEAGGTLFPLELAFEDGKALVRKNWATQPDIEKGTEILSINGKTIPQILQDIFPLISAESEYFKLAKVEFYSFPRFYWLAYGRQDTFEVVVRRAGKEAQLTLPAIAMIEDFEMKRSEIFASKQGLKLFETHAYLNPGHFSGDEDAFRRFVDSAFFAINATKVQNLIIDLRNNTGGEDSFSDYLVSYIADKPFRWNASFRVKTSKVLQEHTRKHSDTTKAYFKEILSRKAGEVYTPDQELYDPQPESKRFKGKVYVLVNRQSYSQAAVTAAQIQDYGWGTIVGEKTGEFPSLFASVFQYPLPNTGILVNIAKGQIVRVNGSTRAEGVIPDIAVRDHLLDDNDEILDTLLDMFNM